MSKQPKANSEQRTAKHLAVTDLQRRINNGSREKDFI